MKPDFLHRLSILMILAVLGFSAAAKEVNATDASGKRQGYWIIKGSMANDRNYAPEAVVEEGNYVNNLKEGLWKKYWPNGKLKSEINYSFGKPEGEYSTYYENGQLEERANWINGKNVGKFNRFYDNGNPQQEFYFADNGKRNGIQKYYYDNGKMALEVSIVNGAEEGVMKRYNMDGSLKEESTFNAGTLKPGSIKEINDKPGGEKIEADPYNEQIGKESETTKDAPNDANTFKPNGYNVLYDLSNQITQVGQFKNGRLWDGKWYRYSPEGLLVRIEIYKSGRYIGTGILADEGK